jgi:hypothetical protein
MPDVRADLERGWTLPADSAPVDFSEHSYVQANERVTRRLDEDRARHELHALLPGSVVQRDPPDWIFKPRRRDVIAWLVNEQRRVCFPLFAGRGSKLGSFVAGTALTPSDTPVGATVCVVGEWPMLGA